MSERRRSREIESLVEELVQQLTEAVEAATAARARVLTEEYRRTAMADAPRVVPPAGSPTTEPSLDVPPSRQRAGRVRSKRGRLSIAAQPFDPEEERRTAEAEQQRRAAELEAERRSAELARLRAILRPTAPIPPAPPVSAPPVRAPDDEGSLQVLESQIRDRISSLPGLSVSRYTAQIAAWVGRVRLHQSGPEGERTRIASRIMFDKLRNLAWSMEAGPIEALNTSWSTRRWEQYIEDNELIAATPDAPPRPEPDADAAVWATPGDVDAQT